MGEWLSGEKVEEINKRKLVVTQQSGDVQCSVENVANNIVITCVVPGVYLKH